MANKPYLIFRFRAVDVLRVLLLPLLQPSDPSPTRQHRRLGQQLDQRGDHLPRPAGRLPGHAAPHRSPAAVKALLARRPGLAED